MLATACAERIAARPNAGTGEDQVAKSEKPGQCLDARTEPAAETAALLRRHIGALRWEVWAALIEGCILLEDV
jgi:hypothetical protein